MGMTIEHVNKLLSVITATITEDDDCFTIEDENLQVFKETLLTAIDTMRKYQMMQADYEARLKADMAAMLTEIQLEIEEMFGLCTEIHGDEWNEINTVHSQDVLSLIQQKINALKGE